MAGTARAVRCRETLLSPSVWAGNKFVACLDRLLLMSRSCADRIAEEKARAKAASVAELKEERAEAARMQTVAVAEALQHGERRGES